MISVIMSLKSLDDLDGLPVLLGQLEKIGKWKYYAQGHSRHSLHYPMSFCGILAYPSISGPAGNVIELLL
jgi:hypothetical protein